MRLARLGLGVCRHRIPLASSQITPYPIVLRQKHSRVEGAEDISHSTFISTASPSADFNPLQQPSAGIEHHTEGDENIGRLSPTNSHLFKLILPLPKPTAFLLHPSQPLSHLSRLIVGSLPTRNAEITYLALTGQEDDVDSHLRAAESDAPHDRQGNEGGPYLGEREKGRGRWQEVSWSQSTDLSDFIKQSCLNEQFKIVIERDGTERTIKVVIPSFASRTTYLRERLLKLTKELERVTKQKKSIDLSAHKTAQRLGTGALTLGVIYWVAVVRWTFFTDAGWDLMEPFTWATSSALVLGGTGFLIYHNREVSYSSLLDLSITARQRSLYEKHGLDIERWTEMVAEAKTLRREIGRIAQDYDIEWKGELENLAKYSHPSSSSASSSSGATGESGTSKSETEGEDGKTIDIDKTIDEASEMAEKTKETQQKAKDAERKGHGLEERGGGEKDGELEVDGAKAGGDGKKASESEQRGRERAERAARGK